MGTEDKDMPNQNLEFGNRLKTFRTLNGLTQGEVAEVLNLDRSTYTYYEKAACRISTRSTSSRKFSTYPLPSLSANAMTARLMLSKTQAASSTLRASFKTR